MIDRERLFQRYQQLQQYVRWTPADAERIRAAEPLLAPQIPPLVEDFYEEISRHSETRKVITGGSAQIERLKGTLTRWLEELWSGRYDADYVARRWQVGYRHVEIGLDQVYTNAALSRLRSGMVAALEQSWSGPPEDLIATLQSLHKLLDLDLAIIEDAYQAEYTRRQEQAERLATIGHVAGGIAHEMRNPLNVIKTSVYYLLNAKNPTPEKTVQHLERIQKQVGLADGVVAALANFARLPVPNFRPFSITQQVAETLSSLELPARIEVVVDAPPSLPPVLGDAAQIGIVLSNLIRNARDAMPEGGRLTIALRQEQESIDIAVSDTGDGIAPENLPRIMEPLFTTKARGIGLGLAIARAIAEKNHGKLSAASRPGQGATFTIRLPVAVDPA